MIHHRKNKKYYGLLSIRRQKQMHFSVKRDILRAAPVLGGLFYTHDYLHGKNGWIDCYFLGKDKFTFYNCTLETTRYAYKEAVNDTTWNSANELLPYDYNLIFSRDGKESQPDINAKHAEFGGLTRFEWIEGEQRRLADARSIQVFERLSLHNDYCFGIGLHATIDVPYLTVDTVNNFISQFLEDEKPYCRNDALTYSYDDIEYWGLESNAIVEPLENPPINQAA
jgi:hypothetical protein